MSTPQEFRLFPCLPLEIRDLIWKHTLSPRILALHLDHEGKHAWRGRIHRICFHSGSPELEPSQRRSKILQLARFTPSPLIDAVRALEISRESRDVAIRVGYRAWKFDTPKGEKREIIWNPELDIVLFARPWQRGIADYCTEIFYAQCEAEAKIVRRLVVPSANWSGFCNEETRFEYHCAKFEGLRELIVILNNQHEVQEGIQLDHLNQIGQPSDISESIMQDFQKVKAKEKREDWVVPSVRIVRNEGQILGGRSLESPWATSCDQ